MAADHAQLRATQIPHERDARKRRGQRKQGNTHPFGKRAGSTPPKNPELRATAGQVLPASPRR
eukprot:4610272-Pyramimonas_sp.AAC.1